MLPDDIYIKPLKNLLKAFLKTEEVNFLPSHILFVMKMK